MFRQIIVLTCSHTQSYQCTARSGCPGHRSGTCVLGWDHVLAPVLVPVSAQPATTDPVQRYLSQLPQLTTHHFHLSQSRAVQSVASTDIITLWSVSQPEHASFSEF